MSINKTQLKKIARLARLDLDDANIDSQIADFNNLLNLIASMNQLDTDGVAPMAHPLQITQPTREDVANEPEQRELLQKSAPATEDGLYLVPQVIDS